MSEIGTTRVTCNACEGLPPQQARHCRECRGLGYFERTIAPDNCTRARPECPVEYEPMVNGWMCSRCGQSGPIQPTLASKDVEDLADETSDFVASLDHWPTPDLRRVSDAFKANEARRAAAGGAGDPDLAERLLAEAVGCEDLARRASIEKRFREGFAEVAMYFRQAAERITELEAATSPVPGDAGDLAGQGEPVAWAYEVECIGRKVWSPQVSLSRPPASHLIRNIRPLYEAAPRAAATEEEIAEAIRSRVFRRLESPTAIERALREAAEAVLALFRDADRAAGEGER